MSRYWLTHVAPSGRSAWQLFVNGQRAAHVFYEPEGNVTTIAFVGLNQTIDEVLQKRRFEPGLDKQLVRRLHTALEGRQLIVQTGALTLFARHQYGFTVGPESARNVLERMNSGFVRATSITLPYLLRWDHPIEDDRSPWEEPKRSGTPAGQEFRRTVHAARWVSADRDQVEIWVRERWTDSGGQADGQVLLAEALQKKRLAQMLLGPVGQMATKLASSVR